MKTFPCVTVLFMTAHIFAQDFATVKNGRVKTEVWIPKTSGCTRGNKIEKDQICLFFFWNFNDTALIVFNNQQIYKGYLNIDSSQPRAVAEIKLVISKSIDDNILQIELINSSDCMAIELNCKYKIVEVYK